MKINFSNGESIKPFFEDLKKVLIKHNVEFSGFGNGYEVDEDILEFSNDKGWVELIDFGGITKENVGTIIEKLQ